ncbi:hypothetical protein J1N35_038406 [Gossypium stocksii]|uniref:Uncharacterized protein n=1 Tax=Gossypium stocksii TaxID=47602 RepID=A0A9D3ULT0_9ROSI|nr:hypothetical protein J1N35_038406 [Gossypium stocksii]
MDSEGKQGLLNSGSGNSELGTEALAELRTEPRSVKHVKTRPNIPTCKNCNGRHPGKCHRKKGACPRCGSREYRAQDCQAYSS